MYAAAKALLTVMAAVTLRLDIWRLARQVATLEACVALCRQAPTLHG